MAKPVTLLNGRSWHLQGEALTHFKLMLGRYVDQQEVTDAADHSDLLALVEDYDSQIQAPNHTKVGCGVSYFFRGKDTDHPGNTSCFFIMRTDGTQIDFSARKAIVAASKK